MQGMGRKIWAVLGISLGGVLRGGEALKGFWGRGGGCGGARLLFLEFFLDFSIGLALSGSWFFRNIAGEYFWPFLPIGFQYKVFSCWSLG